MRKIASCIRKYFYNTSLGKTWLWKMFRASISLFILWQFSFWSNIIYYIIQYLSNRFKLSRVAFDFDIWSDSVNLRKMYANSFNKMRCDINLLRWQHKVFLFVLAAINYPEDEKHIINNWLVSASWSSVQNTINVSSWFFSVVYFNINFEIVLNFMKHKLRIWAKKRLIFF